MKNFSDKKEHSYEIAPKSKKLLDDSSPMDQEDFEQNEIKHIEDFYNRVGANYPKVASIDPEKSDIVIKQKVGDGSELSSIMDEYKINTKMEMLWSLGGTKYSPDHIIGTPKKLPKLQKDEILYGSKIMKKEEILTASSCIQCGFCTAKERFKNRINLKPKIESDLSFKIADESLCEIDK